jgi:hypothetical protein
MSHEQTTILILVRKTIGDYGTQSGIRRIRVWIDWKDLGKVLQNI